MSWSGMTPDLPTIEATCLCTDEVSDKKYVKIAQKAFASDHPDSNQGPKDCYITTVFRSTN